MKLTVLLKSDVKNILREGFMAILYPMPLFLALALGLGLPGLTELLLPFFDLQNYSLLILMFLLNLGPLLTGMIAGLLLVDEGDNHIFSAIAVTPVGKKGFLFLRLFTPWLWMILVLLPLPLVCGIPTGLPFPVYLIFIVLTALAAPTEALIIAVLAKNKIEAMAVSKMTGIMIIAPFIAWFVPGGFKYLASPLPGFWLSMSLFQQVSGLNSLLLMLPSGLLYASGMLFLLKHFEKRICQ